MGRSTNNVEHKSEPRPEESGSESSVGKSVSGGRSLTGHPIRRGACWGPRPVAALMFLAFLMAFPAPAAAAGLDAEKALLAQGKYKEALAQLEKVWAKAPDNPEALAALLEAKL